MAELVVRMGEIAATQDSGDVLVGLGLGSCIGLVIVDDRGSAAAMAHVVLPESNGNAAAAGKFADTAIPQLVRELTSIGATRSRLSAILVGGAQMFATAGKLDVGNRNEHAVREGLRAHGIPVRAAVTGGTSGRTMRVYLESRSITCKQAGLEEVEIATWGGLAEMARAA
ncbi:MAG TPA: chemotaxis protein CheD [Gaiellales bacterium]